MTSYASVVYKNNELCMDDISLESIAKQFDTPLYVYSQKSFIRNFEQYAHAVAPFSKQSIDALICYSVKSNSNIAILNTLAKAGAGFDIVSGGELKRVLAAGGDPQKVVFSGVGKTHDEIKLALTSNIACFNVESLQELNRIEEIAKELNTTAKISFRINPNVDPKTHPYISTGLKENKFGIPYEEAIKHYQLANALPHIKVTGIDCHIGSQLLDDAPLLEAFDKIASLIEQLDQLGIAISHIDIGGGIGITYDNEAPVAIDQYINRLFSRIANWRNKTRGNKPLTVLLEPGRSISGNAGVLLTTVQYLKENSGKYFAIVDGAMNDLMRPSLYEAYHRILPTKQTSTTAKTYDVVGPICESGDWLGRQRNLSIQPDDVLAILSAGAYGMSMSSNYNSRGRAAEVMIANGKVHLIRERETIEELIAKESIIISQ